MANNIAAILDAGPTCSYEFFPPKDDEQAARLDAAVAALALTNPSFASITCGAMGSTREATQDFAITQNRRQAFPVMPHLTCVGQPLSEITRTLDAYAEGGIRNILALRGDGDEPGDLRHASDLAALIKDRHPNMSVGVAAHPEVHPGSTSRKADRRNLAAKLAVADFAITQFFFGVEPYCRLVDELDELGCKKPIIPGIMLFISADRLRKMASKNNTDIPRTLAESLNRFTTPADIGKLAVDTAAQLITDLSDVLPGIHIYTLNRSQPVLNLRNRLPGWFNKNRAA